MTWTNQTEYISTFTNLPKGSQSITWDEATMQWQDATDMTWDNPQHWMNQSEHVSAFTNETKH